MATNNKDMLQHLADTHRTPANDAINGVQEHVDNGAKYKRADSAALKARIKALHPGCADCADWDGSA